MTKKAGILSTGSCMPSQKVTNHDLVNIVKDYDPSRSGVPLPEWIEKKYDITTRYWVKDELPSDLATEAARLAISRAGLSPKDIDFIVLNTSSGDYPQPTTATVTQGKLGMRSNSFAMEINMPCAGSVYGMSVASSLMATGNFKYGLVIGVEAMTHLFNKEHFIMAGLFADGAGACVLAACDENEGFGAYHLGSMPEEGDESEYALGVIGGGVCHPVGTFEEEKAYHHLKMNSKKVKPFIINSVQDSVYNVLKNEALHGNEIDWVVPHQASKKFIMEGMMHTDIPEDRVAFSLQDYGNTASASILITLDHHHEKVLHPGNKLLFLGVGGGLNWGGIYHQCPANFI